MVVICFIWDKEAQHEVNLVKTSEHMGKMAMLLFFMNSIHVNYDVHFFIPCLFGHNLYNFWFKDFDI